ncbi:uroporphyrinogen-III synthase [Salegentibacter sp. HM20]
MTLLSTKILSPAQKNLLLNSGLSLVEYDAIKIEIFEFDLPDLKIKNAIFTSKNSVKAILKKNPEIENCFCVGPKTSELLQQNNFQIAETAQYGQELAKIIVEKYSNEKFVFFSGNRRRDEIPSILSENGIDFREIEVYKTGLNFQDFQQNFEGILFYSPSGVQSFCELNKPGESIAFCIGETTAAEAKKHFKKIITANKPSVENVIVQAVKELKKKI